jgi:hypothetical protein
MPYSDDMSDRDDAIDSALTLHDDLRADLSGLDDALGALGCSESEEDVLANLDTAIEHLATMLKAAKKAAKAIRAAA